MIEVGWAGILTAWPYVFIGLLFGVMVGYPLGELARRRFFIEKASKEALRKSSALTLDSFIGESHAKNIAAYRDALSLMTRGSAHRAGLYGKSDSIRSAQLQWIAAANSPTLKIWGRIGKVTSRGGDDHRPRQQKADRMAI
jgi:hypothetical protein